MNKKLLILKGIPSSGKTLFAKELIKKEPEKWKRVNKDDLRLMIDGGHWSSKNEKLILKVRNVLIATFLKNGFSVIVDDTNLKPAHETDIRKLVEDYKDLVGEVEVEVKFFDVPLETCIKRDSERANSVGKKVIVDMWKKYLAPPREEYKKEKNLMSAIQIDIDGTLAVMGKRSPYDWQKVDIDTVNESVKAIIDKFNSSHQIIILSGRDSVCREKTEKWLKKNGIEYDALFMREEGDNRSDVIVKRELFEKNVRGKYNVDFVMDDRLSVSRLWHQMGLYLFRVGDPDADF